MGPLTSPSAPRPRAPLSSKIARERGRRGARRAASAPEDAALANGCYVEPTVVRAKPARPRLPGRSVRPVRHACTTFSDDDEALAIANGTDYGLGGGLWTRDLSARAPLRRASAQRAWSGSTATSASIRARRSAASAQSGYGREMGFEAMREYTEAKSVWVNVDAQIPPYYPRG